MKIVITAGGPTLDSPIDQRFGRASGFILFDTKTREHVAMDNSQALDSAQGAGVQAAEAVARTGAECLITGHCGPKAFRALSAAGIRIYNGASGTVAEAIASFEAGKLTASTGADVDGHW